jgi:hypothetical protein
MKTLLAIAVTASLALNAVLIALAFRGLRAANEASSSVPVPVENRTLASGAAALDAAVWPAFETDDLPALVDRLRRAGFPPRYVHAIVAARVEAMFAARRTALQPGREQLPFWKSLPPPDAKLAAAFEALRREQNKMMFDLLGGDANPPDAVIVGDRRRALTHLSPEKADAAVDVLSRYDELSAEIYRRTGGRFVPEDREKLGAIDRERRAALEKVLTPQEITEYELRASPSANQLRADLAAFHANEEEFRAIFALQRPFDERFNRNQVDSLDTAERLNDYNQAHQQLLDQIAAALGPARFADYERANDLLFQQTSRLVARLDLPADAATQVWSIQQSIQQRADAIRSDEGTPAAERDARLAALASEATEKITGTLGPRGLEAYKQYGGGWLTTLGTHPRPKP